MIRNAIIRSLGVLRSLIIYYGIPGRAGRLRVFYDQFVPHGGLSFDIGAHVGNRVRAWRALGARVVAVEPHPDLLRVLHLLYGRDSGVTIVAAALAANDGEARLLVDHTNLTVTTLSPEWMHEVRHDRGFRQVNWVPDRTVSMTTLNALIADYGLPDFAKIDVEGFEAEVLHGLDSALPCLSFEYLPVARERALICIERLSSLGEYLFNWSVGETHRLVLTEWCTTEAISGFIENLRPDSGSGDIYARLQTRR